MEKKMGTMSGIIGLILAVIALFISLFFAWRTFWPDIQLYIYNQNGVESIDNLDLTMEEKLEDFNFFYDTVINSVPMIDEYEEVYGFSFRDRKEVYEELVKGTENDFEFYCIMSAISQEIPSFHTDLVYPVEINGLHCYNIKNVKADKEVLQCSQYWKKLIEDEAKNAGKCQIIAIIVSLMLMENICIIRRIVFVRIGMNNIHWLA